jgi:hypothetical protein
MLSIDNVVTVAGLMLESAFNARYLRPPQTSLPLRSV